MKSKRVYLEDTNKSEKITDMMKKLREKYVHCEDIKVSLDEAEGNFIQNENMDPNQNISLTNIFQTPLQFPKSVHDIKSGDLHSINKSDILRKISNFSEETKEETGEKNYPSKDSDFFTNEKECKEVMDPSYLAVINTPKRSTNAFLSKLNKESITSDREESIIPAKDSYLKYNSQNNQKDPFTTLDFLITKQKLLDININIDIPVSNFNQSPGKSRNFRTFYNYMTDRNHTVDHHQKISRSEKSSLSGSGIYLDDYSEDEFSDSKIDEEINSESSYTDDGDESILIRSPSVARTDSGINNIFAPKNILNGKLTFHNIKLNNNLRSPGTYKKFGLSLNSEIPLSPSDQTHKYLPLKYKNDEKYKSRLFKFLRKPQIPHNKTETCKFVKFKKHSDNFDGNISKYYNSLGMKMRKVSSEKKVYEAQHLFEDNRANVDEKSKHPPQYFKFYSDKDIGFSTKWQVQLKSTEMDDDVETDDDQLKAADRHIMREIGEGIRTYVKNRKNVRNLTLLKFD